MKTNTLHLVLVLTICNWLNNPSVLAQNINQEDFIGTWEVQGNLMGDNGKGWLMPHKQSNPDCEADHTVFSSDGRGKEVTYAANCKPVEKPFQWKLEGSELKLSRGERSIIWHLLSLENGQLKVGVQMRPNSEHRIYVVYKQKH